MGININSYSTLNKYAVLAASGITTVGTTTIQNGDYGTPSEAGVVGNYISTSNGTVQQQHKQN